MRRDSLEVGFHNTIIEFVVNILISYVTRIRCKHTRNFNERSKRVSHLIFWNNSGKGGKVKIVLVRGFAIWSSVFKSDDIRDSSVPRDHVLVRPIDEYLIKHEA